MSRSPSGRNYDLVLFNVELDKLARLGTVDSAEAAEVMLFERLRNFTDSEIPAQRSVEAREGGGDAEGGGAPSRFTAADVISFNAVLNAWAKCGCPERAAALLGRMEHLSKVGSIPFVPNDISYATAIDAWAQSGEKGAPSEAEGILRRLCEAYEDENNGGGDGDWDRDRDRGRDWDRDGDNKAGARAAAVRPTVRMYSSVIHAHAKSRQPGSALAAERLLKRMEECHPPSSGPPSPSSSDLVSRRHLRPAPRPNAYCYTSVIAAWAKTRAGGSARRAVHVLNRMLDRYLSGDASLRPTVVAYAAVIDAWASSGEGGFAAERAEELLRDLEDGAEEGLPAPNVFCYASACKAWARSGRPECGVRAEVVYRRMLERLPREREAKGVGDQAQDWDVSLWPNAIAATAVIDAWAKSSDEEAARHAERILDEMDQLYQEGNKRMRPDFVAYYAVMSAWAKSPKEGSANRAEATLRRMIKDHTAGNEDAEPTLQCVGVAIRAHLNQDGGGERKEGGSPSSVRQAAELLLWVNEMIQSGALGAEVLDRRILKEVLGALERDTSHDCGNNKDMLLSAVSGMRMKGTMQGNSKKHSRQR